ncbi:MAG: transporter substrate-binding domain-containing protein [Saccharospirillaceae bacterium]|nr:hypothetical protein [Pseudomonadales bacterium]NRB81021.1 transporter substrate-binding domain-containing protein [Saccharospirillaceae bacterium]
MIRLLMLFCLIPTLCLAEYKIAIDENLANLTTINLIDDLKEAYRRIDIEADFIVLPGERAVQKTLIGNYQALDVRLLNPEVFHSLIPIQEPIYYSHLISVYSLKEFPEIYDYQDLKQYVVGFARGTQLQKKITSIVPTLRTFNAPDFEILIHALEQGRADVIILSDVMLDVFFDKKIRDRLIKLNNQPLEVINTYHHIHQSQSYLEVSLANVFREMKAEGYFQVTPQY